MKLADIVRDILGEVHLDQYGRMTAEQIFRGLLRGPGHTKAQSATNQWAGRTTLASGSATVTVSTTVVGSDSIINLGIEGNANVASGTNRVVEVKTLSPGNFLTVGTQDGQAIPRDTTVHWMIWKTS